MFVSILLIVLAISPMAASGNPDFQSTGAQPEADNTITRIQLYENGSARWTIQVRTRLETEEEVAQFEKFQDRIEQNESVILDRFGDRMTEVVQSAANNTGRAMMVRNFDVSTRIQQVPQRWGIVQYEFVWEAFAASEGQALQVGDIFEGGFFLSEDDRLIIAPPPGYRIVNSTPNPDSSQEEAVAWTGRKDFADNRPAVLVKPGAGTTAQEIETPKTGEVAHQTTRDRGLIPDSFDKWPEALLIIAAVLVYFLGRRRGIGPLGAPDDSRTPDQSDLSGGGVRTDEEKIRSLLESHDGELRQSAIAEALDWSASKTSRVLSDMADSGEIDRLRIGRENIIQLSDPTEE
ncbi:MAG: DUF4897 domain-containing protein [Halobacteriales archaeon]